MTFEKVFILGAGAVGSVIGALLSRKNDVTLVGNKTHVDEINSKGLSVCGDINEIFVVKADTKIRKIAQKTLIFLTTKGYDSERAVKGIRGLLREDTVILVLQNGLGNEDVVKRAADGRAKVLRGLTTMAAEFFKAGEIRYWKGETTIERNAIAAKVAGILNACAVKTDLCMNIRKVTWNKAVINSVVNPLTAIFQVRNREIATDTLASVRHQVVRECAQVGEAEGITFPANLEKNIDREILGFTNFSSMCQDIMKGKRTEIDFLNGKILELGRKHHVPTPVNEVLVNFIKFLEEKNELPRKN
jgi:2-dehydropantoate 2-reductase